jgi:hypothetical protein
MRQACALVAAVVVGIVVGACGSANNGAKVASNAASNPSTSTTASAHSPSPQAKAIVEYGQPASPADKQAITALVNRYYAAAAADDGATACSLIYSPLSESVAEDYGQAPAPASLAGKTCEVVMSKLFRQVPGQPSAVLATTVVTGVRVKGRKAFALLRSKAMPEGDVPLQRELGIWKIGTLIGGPLPGSPSPAPPTTGASKTSIPHFDEPGTPRVKDTNDRDADPGSNDDEPVIDFGQAASAADEKAIVSLVRHFYSATSAADGPAICSLLYDVVAETVTEDYEAIHGLGTTSCGKTLTKMFASRRRQSTRERRILQVTRVRVEGAKGIVSVYVGKYPEPYFLVHRQGGGWRMQTLFSDGLP